MLLLTLHSKSVLWHQAPCCYVMQTCQPPLLLWLWCCPWSRQHLYPRWLKPTKAKPMPPGKKSYTHLSGRFVGRGIVSLTVHQVSGMQSHHKDPAAPICELQHTSTI